MDNIGDLYARHTPQEVYTMLNDDDGFPDCILGVVLQWGHSAKLKTWRDQVGSALLTSADEPALGFPEFAITIAEYPMMLENRLLWLRPRGNGRNGDGDWHCPLFIRLRPLEDKNKRKRTKEKGDERLDKWRTKTTRSNDQPPASSSSGNWQRSTWSGWQQQNWWQDHQ